MSSFSTCRSCGARIRWVKTVGGKAMPCNAEAIRFTRGGGPETFVTPPGRRLLPLFASASAAPASISISPCGACL